MVIFGISYYRSTRLAPLSSSPLLFAGVGAFMGASEAWNGGVPSPFLGFDCRISIRLFSILFLIFKVRRILDILF
jgi:hypothetical protein